MTPSTQAAAFTVSPDVIDFAAAQRVAPYLYAVLQMTQRLFPDAQRIAATVENDPDIPGDQHLTIEVDVAGMDAKRYADAKFRWGRELFHLCPAPLVCVFRCALHIVEA